MKQMFGLALALLILSGSVMPVLSLDEVDPNQKGSKKPAAHYKLAQALFESGDMQGARNHVLLSLEIAPAYPEAQKLLLKLVRR